MRFESTGPFLNLHNEWSTIYFFNIILPGICSSTPHINSNNQLMTQSLVISLIWARAYLPCAVIHIWYELTCFIRLTFGDLVSCKISSIKQTITVYKTIINNKKTTSPYEYFNRTVILYRTDSTSRVTQLAWLRRIVVCVTLYALFYRLLQLVYRLFTILSRDTLQAQSTANAQITFHILTGIQTYRNPFPGRSW